MSLTEICFLCLAAFVVYTYFGYPLLLVVVGKVWHRPIRRMAFPLPSVSFVVAVYNEERIIARRIEELLRLIENAGVTGEVIIVSDGSTDASAAFARGVVSNIVRIVELPRNGGKSAALSHGCSLAQHEILVFADARQIWSPDALGLLLENFADPEVGAATGDLVLETQPGILAGVGLYWRLEKLLRRTESGLFSTVGVTGAIAAVRHNLFSTIPQGTLLDDVYWPLQVVMRGYRVIHDSRAHAYDRLPDRMGDEFRRKIRTLTGNFQLMTTIPSALLPWRNPICWQYLSHKVFRLLVPWALLALFGLALVTEGRIYEVAFCAQLAFYGLAIIGMTRLGAKLPLAATVSSFFLLNAAAWLSFWSWCFSQGSFTWGKIIYDPVPSFPAIERDLVATRGV
jgi:poly-beta-1,6-N-acetyl-D-glucosamine synthase